MKTLLISLAVLSLAGCSTYKPLPENYAGPIATVADSGQAEDSMKAQIFALTEINGHSIEDSFQTSHSASFNQGAFLRLKITERQIPATQMEVKIRGSHATGAPIHELVSRSMGTFFEVEGLVDFKPEPNAKYVVVGVLSKNASSVWIENAETHQPVTKKVIGK